MCLHGEPGRKKSPVLSNEIIIPQITEGADDFVCFTCWPFQTQQYWPDQSHP